MLANERFLDLTAAFAVNRLLTSRFMGLPTAAVRRLGGLRGCVRLRLGSGQGEGGHYGDCRGQARKFLGPVCHLFVPSLRAPLVFLTYPELTSSANTCPSGLDPAELAAHRALQGSLDRPHDRLPRSSTPVPLVQVT